MVILRRFWYYLAGLPWNGYPFWNGIVIRIAVESLSGLAGNIHPIDFHRLPGLFVDLFYCCFVHPRFPSVFINITVLLRGARLFARPSQQMVISFNYLFSSCSTRSAINIFMRD
jgi:hypothetical protein